MPLRLAILGDSPCDLCTAACCRQNGHEFAVLLEGETERRRFAAFAEDVQVEHGGVVTLERVLPYRGRRCLFLGQDDRCTIYDDRPANCRRFQCVTGYHLGGGHIGRHSPFLGHNPAVVALLERLGAGAKQSSPLTSARHVAKVFRLD